MILLKWIIKTVASRQKKSYGDRRRVMATLSPKRGKVWQILLEKKGEFILKKEL
jgi:hypothetical protein